MESLWISFEKKIFLLFISLKLLCNFLILRLRLLQVNSVVAPLICCQLTVNVSSVWFSVSRSAFGFSATHEPTASATDATLSKSPLTDLPWFRRTCLWFHVFCSSLKLFVIGILFSLQTIFSSRCGYHSFQIKNQEI